MFGSVYVVTSGRKEEFGTGDLFNQLMKKDVCTPGLKIHT